MAVNLKELHSAENMVSELKKAVSILNSWLNLNVGGAEHTKPLKI